MISASIVLYRTAINDIRKVVSCCLNSSIDRLYVIDNSPTNDLHETIRSFESSKIIYIYGQGNVGYGAAHNIALNRSIAEGYAYHVVVNPDIYFKQGTIETIYSFMQSHSDIGQVLPRVIYPDGSLQYLCKLLPTPVDILGRKLLPKSIMERRNIKYEMRASGYDKIRNCPILSGCFMFLRTSVIEMVGGFDDRFFMYFEDFDLTRRIHAVSKTVYFPEVTIVHAHAAEHRVNKILLKESIKSSIKYFNKWGWIFDKNRRLINRNALNDNNIIL